MANLWILGNSFSTEEGKNSWVKRLCDTIQYHNKNQSVGGVSLEYLYWDFHRLRDNIQPDDAVIIILGDLRRRWFLKDDPSNSIYKKIVFKGRASRKIDNQHFINNTEMKVIKSINYYVDYLYKNTEIYNDYLLNFLHNLNYFVKKNNTKVILISVHNDVQEFVNDHIHEFPLLTFGEQCLTAISRSEFKSRELEKSGFLNFNLDLRLNHLVQSNHSIMAHKLSNAIENNKPLRLNQGFITDYLDCAILQDLEFSKRELFDVHLKDDYNNIVEYLSKVA